MSLLSNFANAGFTTASAIIGTVTISIDGGEAIACVENELRASRDYEVGRMAVENTLTVVCRRSVFDAAYTESVNSYFGARATVGGRTLTVESISKGVSHVSIDLVEEEGAR